MLDLLFGVMLATSALNDPMDETALDKRAAGRTPVAVETIEPAAGGTEAHAAAAVEPLVPQHFRQRGNDR